METNLILKMLNINSKFYLEKTFFKTKLQKSNLGFEFLRSKWPVRQLVNIEARLLRYDGHLLKVTLSSQFLFSMSKRIIFGISVHSTSLNIIQLNLNCLCWSIQHTILLALFSYCSNALESMDQKSGIDLSCQCCLLLAWSCSEVLF